METLKDLQTEQKQWQEHNFPNRTWDEPFIGMVEEVGELAHALLKQKQGIRGTYEEHEEAIKDSVADLFIFTADFCNARGIDLEKIIKETWSQVKTRDWVKFPKNGRDK